MTNKTVLVNVPQGCTSRVEPVDVSVNKQFNNYVREQFEKHLDENLAAILKQKSPLQKDACSPPNELETHEKSCLIW